MQFPKKVSLHERKSISFFNFLKTLRPLIAYGMRNVSVWWVHAHKVLGAIDLSTLVSMRRSRSLRPIAISPTFASGWQWTRTSMTGIVHSSHQSLCERHCLSPLSCSVVDAQCLSRYVHSEIMISAVVSRHILVGSKLWTAIKQAPLPIGILLNRAAALLVTVAIDGCKMWRELAENGPNSARLRVAVPSQNSQRAYRSFLFISFSRSLFLCFSLTLHHRGAEVLQHSSQYNSR